MFGSLLKLDALGDRIEKFGLPKDKLSVRLLFPLFSHIRFIYSRDPSRVAQWVDDLMSIH